jgi:L-fuconolactonase
MMRIDAHQHFWKFESAQYPWIRSEWPIRRDFLPPHLKPLLDKAGLDGCVAVQARQSLEESRRLLALATEYSFIKGVVGWVDLQSPAIDLRLAEFANHPRFVGVRHVVQDEPDPNFMLRPAFLRGIGLLGEFDLAYDILVYGRQLPAAIQLARKFPRQRFVLDHIAKPEIRKGSLSPWGEHIRRIAQFPNIFCKISGMVTEADWSRWRPGDFTRYLDLVLAAFGPARLMFGSDWPVCLLAGTYREVHDIVGSWCGKLSVTERRQIFGENARRFYGLY